MTDDRGPDLSALPGAEFARLDGLEAAARAGLPAGWLLHRRVDHSAEGVYGRWTATRGVKPCVWSYLPLTLGLRSTLVDVSVEALRVEAARQEWLAAAYVVLLATTRAAARSR